MSKVWAGLIALTLSSSIATPAFAAASCYDGIQNGPETDVDCGGDCLACGYGKKCTSPHDCFSGRCAEGECDELIYHAGAPVPRGYRLETSTHDAAASARNAGALFFGIGYSAAYVGALALPGRLTWLYAPVIGPFMALEGREGYAKALLIADGVLQGAGAALLIGGIAGRGQQLVRIEWAGISLQPSPAPIGCGVGVLGAF